MSGAQERDREAGSEGCVEQRCEPLASAHHYPNRIIKVESSEDYSAQAPNWSAVASYFYDGLRLPPAPQLMHTGLFTGTAGL